MFDVPPKDSPPVLPLNQGDEQIAKSYPPGKFVCDGRLDVSGTHLHYELLINAKGRDASVTYTDGQWSFEGSAHYDPDDHGINALTGAIVMHDANLPQGQSRSWAVGANLQARRVGISQRGTMGGWLQICTQGTFTPEGTEQLPPQPAPGAPQQPSPIPSDPTRAPVPAAPPTEPAAPADPQQPGPNPESIPGAVGPESPGTPDNTPPTPPRGPEPESVPGASGTESPGTPPDPPTLPGPAPEQVPAEPRLPGPLY